MLARSHSFGIIGLDAHPVTIEVDIGRGLPAVTIVGLPDSAVRESKERVRAAVRNADFDFPGRRITINLAPADIKKEGPAFDLAIALGILAASEQVPLKTLENYAFLGELSLDGNCRPVPGALASAMACAGTSFKGLIVPVENAAEAALAGTVPVYPFRSLGEAVAFLSGQTAPLPYQTPAEIPPEKQTPLPDLADVKGQMHAKRALEIAAAGGHNVILIGPPGGGKTMLARRFPGILPPMTRTEQLEVTRVHSASAPAHLAWARPFRSPHHSASMIALVGGGSDPRPGEVTLAHHGVLFLDELAEFPRAALESLRQPMEDGTVTIARAARTLKFPARFSLVAAMNPCPCGHLTDPRRPCRCPSNEVTKYLNRLSGPLLDRIDIHVELPALSARELDSSPTGEDSASIRARTTAARLIQEERFNGSPTIVNARMNTPQLKAHASLDKTSRELLNSAVEQLGLSARAHDKILKVARTIADLDGKEKIEASHLAEAVGYRVLDRIKI